MKTITSNIKSLSKAQSDFLNAFFKNCPDTLKRNISFRLFSANTTLISTDALCSSVYILLEGRLQAVEERLQIMNYAFTELTAFDIIGDYELFTNETTSIITLKTLEPVFCAVIPAKAYLNWIRNDANALFLRMQMLIHQVVDQTTFDRQNFFLNNRERFMLFLYRECVRKKTIETSTCITLTHIDIANKLGCSLRTVNRMIADFHQKNLFSLFHGKIHISFVQFEIIRKYVQECILKES